MSVSAGGACVPAATACHSDRMPYGGMSNPKDVDDLIAYLMTLK